MNVVFTHPEFFWFLIFVPPAAIRAWVSAMRRRREWAALRCWGRPPTEGAAYWLMAIVLVVVALARPRWGRSSEPPLPPGRDVVLAIDVSRSMAVKDAVPDRLGVAIEAAESLVSALGRTSGDRVAVVAFAGRGVRRCPLTETLGAVGDVLRSLRPGSVHPGGTDLGAALVAAREAFDDQDHSGGRTIVLFSDGEDHSARWESQVVRLREEGTIVHCVAVGDAEAGRPIPDARGGDATYQGEPVESRRVDASLEAIAKGTGGAFVPLGLASIDLGGLYRSRIEPIATIGRQARLSPERGERSGVFLLAALTCVVTACWPSRSRLAIARRRPAAAVMMIALAFLGADAPERPAELVVIGRAEYREGRYHEALSQFLRAAQLLPGSPIPPYDAASACYQLGRFDEAETYYRQARQTADAELAVKIDFGLGNAAVARGDFTAAILRYEDCIASTAPGPVMDRVRADAAENKRFAEENAKRAPAQPDESSEDSSRTPKGEHAPDDKKDAAPSEKGGPRNGPEPKNPGQAERPPSNRRGPGGAGGSGSSRPAPGSPEDQLAQAIENVREARERRLTDDVPEETDKNLKDW